MGTWGPGIFSDDTAAHIRDEYRDLLEAGVPDDEATHRVIDGWKDLGTDEHLLWLALAATQSRLGRLDEVVKAHALEIIDQGRGLGLWQAASNGRIALLRVFGISDDRTGVAPVLGWLDWHGRTIPTEGLIQGVRVADFAPFDRQQRPDTYVVCLYRKEDPDWRESGFVLVARVPSNPDDEQVEGWTGLGWDTLADAVEGELIA